MLDRYLFSIILFLVYNMNLFNTSLSDCDPTSLIFDENEVKRCVNKYIKSVNISKWSSHFNRIFVIPENSFNIKYFIKVSI